MSSLERCPLFRGLNVINSEPCSRSGVYLCTQRPAKCISSPSQKYFQEVVHVNEILKLQDNHSPPLSLSPSWVCVWYMDITYHTHTLTHAHTHAHTLQTYSHIIIFTHTHTRTTHTHTRTTHTHTHTLSLSHTHTHTDHTKLNYTHTHSHTHTHPSASDGKQSRQIFTNLRTCIYTYMYH